MKAVIFHLPGSRDQIVSTFTEQLELLRFHRPVASPREARLGFVATKGYELTAESIGELSGCAVIEGVAPCWLRFDSPHLPTKTRNIAIADALAAERVRRVRQLEPPMTKQEEKLVRTAAITAAEARAPMRADVAGVFLDAVGCDYDPPVEFADRGRGGRLTLVDAPTALADEVGAWVSKAFGGVLVPPPELSVEGYNLLVTRTSDVFVGEEPVDVISATFPNANTVAGRRDVIDLLMRYDTAEAVREAHAEISAIVVGVPSARVELTFRGRALTSMACDDASSLDGFFHYEGLLLSYAGPALAVVDGEDTLERPLPASDAALVLAQQADLIRQARATADALATALLELLAAEE